MVIGKGQHAISPDEYVFAALQVRPRRMGGGGGRRHRFDQQQRRQQRRRPSPPRLTCLPDLPAAPCASLRPTQIYLDVVNLFLVGGGGAGWVG